jgi:hypothetical protein
MPAGQQLRGNTSNDSGRLTSARLPRRDSPAGASYPPVSRESLGTRIVNPQPRSIAIAGVLRMRRRASVRRHARAAMRARLRAAGGVGGRTLARSRDRESATLARASTPSGSHAEGRLTSGNRAHGRLTETSSPIADRSSRREGICNLPRKSAKHRRTRHPVMAFGISTPTGLVVAFRGC